MTEIVSTGESGLNSVAKSALDASARLWFLVAALGQGEEGQSPFSGHSSRPRAPSLSARMALNSEPDFHRGHRLELPKSLMMV